MIVRRLSSPVFPTQSHLGRLGPDALEFALLEIVFFGNGLDKTRGGAVEVFGDFSEKRHLDNKKNKKKNSTHAVRSVDVT
jgi:hypothetical protein